MQENIRSLVTDVHCKWDSGARVWPASSREYTSEICTPPLFTAGTPSMKNDLNFLIFNSIILDSLMAGTSCLLAAWV